MFFAYRSYVYHAFEGKTQRPIAHTCGPLLELPSTCQSYNEFSKEFSELLSNEDARQFTIVCDTSCSEILYMYCIIMFKPKSES